MTFASAAISYMQSGRSKLFLAPLIEHFGDTPLDQIDQASHRPQAQCLSLGHHRKPQTNNRLIYTPVLAILRHAGDFDHAIEQSKVLLRPAIELNGSSPMRRFGFSTRAERS